MHTHLHVNKTYTCTKPHQHITHAHIAPHTCPHTHTCAHTHAHTHTRMHTHSTPHIHTHSTHTHTHTHTYLMIRTRGQRDGYSTNGHKIYVISFHKLLLILETNFHHYIIYNIFQFCSIVFKVFFKCLKLEEY